MESIRVSIELAEEYLSFDFNNSLCAQLVDVYEGKVLGSLTAIKAIKTVSFPNVPISNRGSKRPISTRNTQILPRKRSNLPSKLTAVQQSLLQTSTTFVMEAPSQKVDAHLLINTLTNPNSSEKLYQCSFCSVQAVAKSSVKRHIEIKHIPSETYDCLTCSKKCNLKSNLKKHYMKFHQMPEVAANAMLAR